MGTKRKGKCRTATNKGIAHCLHSKAVDEVVIENAFLEMFNLLADNFDDGLESVLESVETTLANDESIVKLSRIDKSLSVLESKWKKLTDMLLDDKITKEAYDEKYNDFTMKINQARKERELYVANVGSQKDVGKRMKEIRRKLSESAGIKQCDRFVFKSIVKKVIIGETNPDGSVDPYKLTFVLKGIKYNREINILGL